MVHTRKSGERIDIAVAVPSTGSWRTQTSLNMIRAFMHFSLKWKKPKNVNFAQIRLLSQTISCLPQSRHNLVKRALRANCTHVLFIDSDMAFPEDLISRLWMRDKDVIGVNCTTRRFPTHFIAHDLDWQTIDSRDKKGIQKVQHVGTGIMMVKTEVFKKMQPPLFMFEWIPNRPDEQNYSGEDVYFCAKCDEVGVDVWVDHDLSKECGHIGTQVFGPGTVGIEEPQWNLLERTND